MRGHIYPSGYGSRYGFHQAAVSFQMGTPSDKAAADSPGLTLQPACVIHSPSRKNNQSPDLSMSSTSL